MVSTSHTESFRLSEQIHDVQVALNTVSYNTNVHTCTICVLLREPDTGATIAHVAKTLQKCCKCCILKFSESVVGTTHAHI